MSLTANAYRWMLNNEFLSPCNYPLRKHDIKEKLSAKILFAERNVPKDTSVRLAITSGNNEIRPSDTKVKSIWNSVFKACREAVRYLARIICIIGICTLVVPDLFKSTYDLVKICGKIEQCTVESELKTLKNQITDRIVNLIYQGSLLGSLALLAIPVPAKFKITSNIMTAITPLIIMRLTSSLPTLAISRQELPGVIYSQLLREKFGLIVGKLEMENLNTLDIATEIGGHIGEVIGEQAFYIMEAVRELQSALPQNARLPHEYPPNEVLIKHHLDNRNISLEARYKLQALEMEFARYAEMLDLFHTFVQKISGKTISIDLFKTLKDTKAFPDKYIADCFNGVPLVNANNLLMTLKHDLQPIEIPKNASEGETEYLNLRNRLIKQKEPNDFLSVPLTANNKEIKRAYHTLSATTHPDKAPSKYKEDAETIFKLLGTAYQLADAAATKRQKA